MALFSKADEELLQSFATGQTSLKDVIKELRRKVRIIIRGGNVPALDAPDVEQAVWIGLHVAREAGRELNGPVLRTIAENQAAEYHREQDYGHYSGESYAVTKARKEGALTAYRNAGELHFERQFFLRLPLAGALKNLLDHRIKKPWQCDAGLSAVYISGGIQIIPGAAPCHPRSLVIPIPLWQQKPGGSSGDQQVLCRDGFRSIDKVDDFPPELPAGIDEHVDRAIALLNAEYGGLTKPVEQDEEQSESTERRLVSFAQEYRHRLQLGALKLAIRKLEPNYRDAVILRFYLLTVGCVSLSVIARAVGIGSVKAAQRWLKDDGVIERQLQIIAPVVLETTSEFELLAAAESTLVPDKETLDRFQIIAASESVRGRQSRRQPGTGVKVDGSQCKWKGWALEVPKTNAERKKLFEVYNAAFRNTLPWCAHCGQVIKHAAQLAFCENCLDNKTAVRGLIDQEPREPNRFNEELPDWFTTAETRNDATAREYANEYRIQHGLKPQEYQHPRSVVQMAASWREMLLPVIDCLDGTATTRPTTLPTEDCAPRPALSCPVGGQYVDDDLLEQWARDDDFELTDDWQPYIDPRDGTESRLASAQLFKNEICPSVRRLNGVKRQMRFRKLLEKRKEKSRMYNRKKGEPTKPEPVASPVTLPPGWRIDRAQPINAPHEPQTSPLELDSAEMYRS